MHVVAGGAVEDVRGAVAGQRVVRAAAAQPLDISLDVVELTALTIVGAVSDRDGHRRGAGVVGDVRSRAALLRVATGAALQRVVGVAALQHVGAVAAQQRVRAAATGERVRAALADQPVGGRVAGQRVAGAAAPDLLDIVVDMVALAVSPSL